MDLGNFAKPRHQKVIGIVFHTNLFLLRELEPEQLSRKQLLDIGFLRMPKEFQAWVERFDSRIRSKAAVMLALYQWCSPGEDRVEEVLADLSAEERERTGSARIGAAGNGKVQHTYCGRLYRPESYGVLWTGH